jgi:hypothetical protein
MENQTLRVLIDFLHMMNPVYGVVVLTLAMVAYALFVFWHIRTADKRLLAALKDLKESAAADKVITNNQLAEARKVQRDDQERLRSEVRQLESKVRQASTKMWDQIRADKAEGHEDIKMSTAFVESRFEGLSDKYINLNAIALALCVNTQNSGGPAIVKQSADGDGNFAKNYDIHGPAKANT